MQQSLMIKLSLRKQIKENFVNMIKGIIKTSKQKYSTATSYSMAKL
jgi:hypothetical protein